MYMFDLLILLYMNVIYLFSTCIHIKQAKLSTFVMTVCSCSTDGLFYRYSKICQSVHYQQGVGAVGQDLWVGWRPLHSAKIAEIKMGWIGNQFGDPYSTQSPGICPWTGRPLNSGHWTGQSLGRYIKNTATTTTTTNNNNMVFNYYKCDYYILVCVHTHTHTHTPYIHPHTRLHTCTHTRRHACTHTYIHITV